MKDTRTFSQFLSATMGPSVARVSAPRTIPSLKRQPTMVVPVLVALGSLIPLSFKYVFLYEKVYVLIQANGFLFI